MKLWTLSAGWLCLRHAVAAQEDIWSKMINNDTNGAWNFQPEKPKAKYFKVATGIPGDHAFRVKATKGANPWDVQASSPIAGAINEGDVIMLCTTRAPKSPPKAAARSRRASSSRGRRTPRCWT